MTTARVPEDGIYVPSPTFLQPFDKASSNPHPSIDTETQVNHTIHLAKCGITGVVLMGSSGEAIHLTRTERRAIVHDVRRGLENAGFRDYPIMAGVLINNTEEVIEWLQDAHESGAQWGLVLTPGYFGGAASQQGLVQWFTVVADRSPIPILIYNYPGVCNGQIMTPETYVALAAHPNIVGCKMTHTNVSHHLQVSLNPRIDHKSFRVFSGLGQQLGPIVFFKAAGAIDALSGIFPKTATRLYTLVSKRPIEEAALDEGHKLQWLFSSGEEYIGATGVIGIREAVYRVLGYGNLEGGRAPLRGGLAVGEWEKWSEIMAQLIETEKSL